METVVVRKPTVEEGFRFVETECVVQDTRSACTAPPNYKCPYRRVKVVSQ